MARRALGPAALHVVQAVEVVPDAPLVIACSGGPDSLALAGAAAVVAGRRRASVRAVIVDHGLQDGSDAVAAAVVEQLREVVAVPATVLTVTVAPGAGPEASARDARYAALEADARPGELVLLGHTLDDQAETVLLGLARGSGGRSLAGMPAQRGRFLRPLLGLRRHVTADACGEFGLQSWSDPHNEQERFARVRVRRNVLPFLEAEIGPGVAEALARSAALLRADADLLDALAEDAAAAQPDGALDCGELLALAAPLRSRVLRRWLQAHGAAEVSAQHLTAAAALVENWHGQRWVDLPGVRVRRESGRLLATSL